MYASFPFEWTVKSTTKHIKFRTAYDINEIDEVFCSIIEQKGRQIKFTDLGSILGFNLQDLGEIDILRSYIDSLIDYNLIKISKDFIYLTNFGQDALLNRLKYKYYFAETELFENQTANGNSDNFSFKTIFNLENKILLIPEINELKISTNQDCKETLQSQLFNYDNYTGEVIEIIKGIESISYRSFTLQCDITCNNNNYQLSIFNSGVNKVDIENLIYQSNNVHLKDELVRKGMFNHILTDTILISSLDVIKYSDLWDWKKLANDSRVNWMENNFFELFRINGDASIWNTISENAPIERIKILILTYKEYWNWTILTKRFNNEFISLNINDFNWDFKIISYKDITFVCSLIKLRSQFNINSLWEEAWDWKYISLNAPNDFIEFYIDDFPWDFYSITELRSDVLRNLLRKANKYEDYSKIILTKAWNWKFISEFFDLKYIYNQLSSLAKVIDWKIILYRFFNDEFIAASCLDDETFKSLLVINLPGNFIVSHQNYLWSEKLIDFFDQLILIQWETTSYIKGLDTNPYLNWNKTVFQRYNSKITSPQGKYYVSLHIIDYTVIEDNLYFDWNWEGVSNNVKLINGSNFLNTILLRRSQICYYLSWDRIFNITTIDINFWNKHLDFLSALPNERVAELWKLITKEEDYKYVLLNYKYPWDWKYITEICSEDIIIQTYNTDLFAKWDWSEATRKINRSLILRNIEGMTKFVNWKYLINEAFDSSQELALENSLPRIANCLSTLEKSKKSECWEMLTVRFSFETLFNYVEETFNLEMYEWDWSYISNHKQFPSDINTIKKFINLINWTVLSGSISIQRKFSINTWNNHKEWFENIDNYLQSFKEKWDWKILSKNSDLCSSRSLLRKFRSFDWDWEYLSEFGTFLKKQKNDKDDYLLLLVEQFRNIKFELISKRNDIIITNDLVILNQEQNWDWDALSRNNSLQITSNTLLELKNKPWNWNFLSKHRKIIINNSLLLALIDKDWDWILLSDNVHLEFNSEFIDLVRHKPWNWQSISRNTSFLPSVEILAKTKDFDLDWTHLSNNSNLMPTIELLSKFESKWNWHSITRCESIELLDINLIQRFATKWDWDFICNSKKFDFNNEILFLFKEHINWDIVSANNNIIFTKDIVQEFRQFWNWTALKKNKRVLELLGNYIINEINKSSILTFIDKLGEQHSPWGGYVYHFSHIDNAVEIIKSRKIQSRNKATIKSDAAGNVVHIRNDAHDYARFYFRPQTPTQFYNEFLGKNTTDGYENKNSVWVSWYEKARNLGFPKCPVPIFFKFSLKEVLFLYEKNCCISNGNMQTSSTIYDCLDNMIDKFGFDDLFYTPKQYATADDYTRYRSYAQQEFLVQDELLFDSLIDVHIVCASNEDKLMLIRLLGQENKDVFSKIIVDSKYYNNDNPRVEVDYNEDGLNINTTYHGDGYFILNCANSTSGLEIISGDVIKIEDDKIIFDSCVSVKNLSQAIRLYFIDESGRNWLIYDNKEF